MRRLLFSAAALAGIFSGTTCYALPVVLFSSINDLTATPYQSNLASTGPSSLQAFDTFKLDLPSIVMAIDFVVSPYAFSFQPITVAIVPISGKYPSASVPPLYKQTFSRSNYTVTQAIHPTGPVTEIITVQLPGSTLAAGSYDITFYGPSLNVVDFANGTLAGDSLYQSGFGFRTDYSLGFDLIGATVAIPEPGSMMLLATGPAGLAALSRRRRSAAGTSGR
jgi:PEP-CTERM motif-containing protein